MICAGSVGRLLDQTRLSLPRKSLRKKAGIEGKHRSGHAFSLDEPLEEKENDGSTDKMRDTFWRRGNLGLGLQGAVGRGNMLATKETRWSGDDSQGIEERARIA